MLLWPSLAAAFSCSASLLFAVGTGTLRRQISQRREAERRLEEQLAFVQMMLDALPNQVVLTNERYEVAMTNRAYRQMFLGGEPDGLPMSGCSRIDRPSRSVPGDGGGCQRLGERRGASWSGRDPVWMTIACTR